MKKVFLQGSFDLLNAGHVRFISEGRKQGDYLIVGLNSDELIRWYKKREPMMPYRQRKELLEAIKYIDKVIPCHEPQAINYLKKLKVDVYVYYEEWVENQFEAIEWMKQNGKKTHRINKVKNLLSSTDLRTKI